MNKKKFRSEPENTELNSGPVKADSDPVSKSQNSKKNRESKENPSKGVKTNAENSSGNLRFPSELFPDNPTVSDSSGNSPPLRSKADNKEKSNFKIPKKTEVLYSKNESDLEGIMMTLLLMTSCRIFSTRNHHQQFHQVHQR